MGWRFQKRIKLLPGVTMNLGKTGGSFSFGPRGAKVTVGKDGIRKTFGIPGTGLSYTTYDRYDQSAPGGSHGGRSAAAPQNTLDVGFFSGLFLSGDEKKFIDGVKALLAGDAASAANLLSQLPGNPDANFILAVIRLNAQQYPQCKDALNNVSANIQNLGFYFKKYNLALDMSFPITDVFAVDLSPCPLAVDLLRAEVLQHTNEIASACNLLLEWHKKDSTNLLVKISLAELVLSAAPTDVRWLKTLIAMTDHVENDSPIHTVLLYYRGLVFKNLKLFDVAQEVFSAIARKKKDRDSELMIAIQEERARVYELQGQNAAARKIWEKIYAEDSSNAEAARKINLLK